MNPVSQRYAKWRAEQNIKLAEIHTAVGRDEVSPMDIAFRKVQRLREWKSRQRKKKREAI
jgi:hypothetical protein